MQMLLPKQSVQRTVGPGVLGFICLTVTFNAVSSPGLSKSLGACRFLFLFAMIPCTVLNPN